MQRREHIPFGYRTFTGRLATCKAWVDDYNRTQDDINIWIDAGRELPEWLLDWSHQQFCLLAYGLPGEKKEVPSGKR